MHPNDWQTSILQTTAGPGVLYLPELFAHPPAGALYHQPGRQGVAAVAVPTGALEPDTLQTILDFRFVNYLAAGIIDPADAARLGVEREDPASVGEGDIHFLAGTVDGGELLCYSLLNPLPAPDPEATLCSRDRPLSYPEHYGGWGIFNQLRILPDLPLDRVWQLGRIMKSVSAHGVDDLGARGPVEVSLAIYHTLLGRLRDRIAGIVMGFEDNGAARNAEFFNTPFVLLTGAIWAETADDLFGRYVSASDFRSGAMLLADFGPDMDARRCAIEAALALPGDEALDALFELHRTRLTPPSSLVPAAGLDPLSDVPGLQAGLSWDARLALRSVGWQLERCAAFASLTECEARTLAAFLQPLDLAAGAELDAGAATGAMWVVLDGQVELRPRHQPGAGMAIEARATFGEEAMLGDPPTYRVVATQPTRLLRLDQATFERFLARRPAVWAHVTATALERLHALGELAR